LWASAAPDAAARAARATRETNLRMGVSVLKE
jgi:hypothetical protein